MPRNLAATRSDLIPGVQGSLVSWSEIRQTRSFFPKRRTERFFRFLRVSAARKSRWEFASQCQVGSNSREGERPISGCRIRTACTLRSCQLYVRNVIWSPQKRYRHWPGGAFMTWISPATANSLVKLPYMLVACLTSDSFPFHSPPILLPLSRIVD